MKELVTEKKTECQPCTRTKSVQNSVGYKQEGGQDFVGLGYHPPERFVPLLAKFSHPANATQQAQLFIQLQRHYGNRYVQRVVSAYRSQNVEEDKNTSASELISKKDSGRPLEPEVREFMEPRFGYDLSPVRIHTDSYAIRNSNELNAEAFTIGGDIFFNEGRYNPFSTDGKKLLAHELSHVVQQSEGTSIQRVPLSESAFQTATFARFVTTGRVRCCRDRGRGECPPHLGVARPGDPRPQNGMNLVFSIAGHRPGMEYGFVQVISFRRCIRYSASLGGGWDVVDSGGPGHDDSPVADATCPIPDARNEITMTDAPGFKFALGGSAIADTDELTLRMNANNWVIARERPGRWRRISELFQWHSVTRIRRDVAGNWELVAGANRIGTGFTRIGSCPPPS